MTPQEMKARLVELRDQVHSIQQTAESERREITPDEEKRIMSLYTEFRSLDVQLDNTDDIDLPSNGRRAAPQPISSQNRTIGQPSTGRNLFRDQSSGKLIQGYTHGQPIGQQDNTALGEIVRAAVLNDWSGLSRDIRNAVTGGSDVGGGYLLEPTLSPRFIDLARSASVVSRAGAVTVPIMGETHLATIESDPTTSWRGETVSVTASKPAFGRIILRPKTVAALVPVSIEWLEDVANGAQIIQTALQGAMGLAMDKAALAGSGAASEPLGVVNHSGVNPITGVGTPTTYSQISAAVGDILAANYDGEISALTWISNPVQGETYDGLVTGITGDNTPLQATKWASELRKMHTTSLEANTSSEYQMVVGDFSQVIIGARTSGMTLEVLNAGTATDADSTSYNAATDLMRFIRVYARIDTALMRPSWFSVLSGVTV